MNLITNRDLQKIEIWQTYKSLQCLSFICFRGNYKGRISSRGTLSAIHHTIQHVIDEGM